VTGKPISRRRALGLIALGGASLAAGATGWVGALGAPGARGRLRPGPAGQLLTQPTVLASRNGVLPVRLTAAAGVWLAGRDTRGLGFNGISPGPTLRVRPGELLQVRLVNQLDQPTNLHTHGLHVSPDDHGDNPFVTINPGAAFDYSYRIPASHPAGTFWYHPHHHGHVADQLFGGLAGALLVDAGPDLPVARDRVLLVMDTTLDAAGRVAAVSAMDRMMGREGELVLVNGQYQPRIVSTPGVAERWRVINGCTSQVLALRLDGHEFTQVALDGNFLPTRANRDRVVLAPGNRTDLIVCPTSSGQFALVTDPYDRGSAGMMGGMGMGGASTSDRPITLATLVVTGPAASPASLPAALPAPPRPQRPPAARRELTFAMGMGPGGMRFTIDGDTFDPTRDDYTARLGSTEDWTIINTSPMEHPFHLHVWPFQVLADSTPTAPTAILQDVVLIPARGWVRLRIPFTDFLGRSVYHCHILDHEDAGMMATVNVRTP
jgi:FtsP/CotA-like multicopper oxidase with cupredoxin domain